MRGSRALVTMPKLESEIFPDGLMNCAWLKMLKNSKRRSNENLSLIAVRFKMPKSVLLNPGPWKNRRLAVPNVPGTQFCANAPTLGKQAASVTSPGNSGVCVAIFGGGGVKEHPVPSLGGQFGFRVRGFRVF